MTKSTSPPTPPDPWAGHPLLEIYGGVDAPRCATCGRPYSRMEAAAGMRTCEHCPPIRTAQQLRDLVDTVIRLGHQGLPEQELDPAAVEVWTQLARLADTLSAPLSDARQRALVATVAVLVVRAEDTRIEEATDPDEVDDDFYRDRDDEIGAATDDEDGDQ